MNHDFDYFSPNILSVNQICIIIERVSIKAGKLLELKEISCSTTRVIKCSDIMAVNRRIHILLYNLYTFISQIYIQVSRLKNNYLKKTVILIKCALPKFNSCKHQTFKVQNTSQAIELTVN
jgi:hypothetical protein